MGSGQEELNSKVGHVPENKHCKTWKEYNNKITRCFCSGLDKTVGDREWYLLDCPVVVNSF